MELLVEASLLIIAGLVFTFGAIELSRVLKEWLGKRGR